MFESDVTNWVELIVIGIELVAVLIIVVAIITATARLVYRITFRKPVQGLYQIYRKRLAQAILMGLEVLIAADVIRTVALDRTIEAIVVLGLLVLIRIILSWSLLVEIDHHWPWQPKNKNAPEDEEL